MYHRKSKKPNGRTYLTIAQGYRGADGKNKTRTARSLGYVDALEAEFDDPCPWCGRPARPPTTTG